MKYLLIVLLLASNAAFSQTEREKYQVQFHLWGISHHFGGIPSQQARLRISSDDTTIFNPGIGILVDFRHSVTAWDWYGFSPIVMLNVLADCDVRPLITFGPGIRWRYPFTRYFSIEMNVLANLALGQDWRTSTYHPAFLPTPFVGFNYHASPDFSVGALFTYVPPNSGMSATSNNGLLFFGLNFTL